MLNKNTIIRSIGWGMVLLIIVLSLIRLPATTQTIPNSDKLMHLLSYFWLTFWFLHAYPKATIPTVIGFIVLGVGLEWLQSMTGYRHFEWLDLAMNSVGVITAYLLFNYTWIKINCILIRKQHDADLSIR